MTLVAYGLVDTRTQERGTNLTLPGIRRSTSPPTRLAMRASFLHLSNELTRRNEPTNGCIYGFGEVASFPGNPGYSDVKDKEVVPSCLN